MLYTHIIILPLSLCFHLMDRMAYKAIYPDVSNGCVKQKPLPHQADGSLLSFSHNLLESAAAQREEKVAIK